MGFASSLSSLSTTTAVVNPKMEKWKILSLRTEAVNGFQKYQASFYQLKTQGKKNLEGIV